MYLYMEASSPAKRGDTGRFVSEELTVNPNFKFCVDFWYHMFGDGAGALRVQIKYNSAFSTRKIISTKWSMEGNQGNEWRHAQVNISSSYDFQVCVISIFNPSFLLSFYSYIQSCKKKLQNKLFFLRIFFLYIKEIY